jgi:hypothetical protein
MAQRHLSGWLAIWLVAGYLASWKAAFRFCVGS